MVTWPGEGGQITNLGKLLDPVADKLLVASALILLVQFQRVEVWLAIVMIARELIVTGARAVAAKEGFVVPADSYGKLKVVCQISGILCLILEEVIQIPFLNLHIIGTLVLYIALAVALISGGRYLLKYLRKSVHNFFKASVDCNQTYGLAIDFFSFLEPISSAPFHSAC